MSQVFRRYPHGGGEMLLALALADAARDDGVLVMHESVGELARKTRQTDRGVRQQLARMLTSGWLLLVKASEGGRGKTTMYRISRAWLEGADLEGGPVDNSDGSERNPERGSGFEGGNPERGSGFSPPETRNVVQGLQTRNPERGSGAYITGNSNTPPSPPRGAPGGSKKVIHTPADVDNSRLIGFKGWLERCAAEGVKPIPEGDPVFAYCDTVGISADLLGMHWREFKRARAAASKRQAGIEGWRQAFRNSVRGNWYQLWYLKPGSEAVLTTRGEQARREQQAERAAAAQQAAEGAQGDA